MPIKAKLKQLWQNADGIVILAGAGMSVDSGLPDFRGSTGLWTKAKEDFITHATAKGFDNNPLVAWNFYISRILQYGTVQPHRGYTDLLTALQQHKKDYFVVTSNVDTHFQKAGYDPLKISEIHGSLSHVQCVKACCRDLYPMPQFTAELVSVDDAPKCPKCGNLLRPNVMMFSDPYLIWTNIDKSAERYAHWSTPKFNLVGIELGAGLAIPSIRMFGEERTASLIRINPHESETNRAQDVGIAATALDGLDFLLSSI